MTPKEFYDHLLANKIDGFNQEFLQNKSSIAKFVSQNQHFCIYNDSSIYFGLGNTSGQRFILEKVKDIVLDENIGVLIINSIMALKYKDES